MDIDTPHCSSLTHPKERATPLPSIEEDILIIGMPVYEERVPSFVLPCLKQLQGHGQPAVVVAMYGNVGVGVTLKQLAFEAETQGFPVIGGASFIGEHSFCHEALPIATGRPDEQDLRFAQDFGVRLTHKPTLMKDCSSPPKLAFPAKLPLMARILPENSSSMFTYPPHIDPDVCTHCRACVKACPMGAINATTLDIHEQLCVRCFACVRRCPMSARRISLKKAWFVRRALRKAVQQRQEPQFYL